MRVGVFYFNPDYGIDTGELARALEERGFASLYVPEHTHIPTSRRTPFPAGGELPKRYSHIRDPFVGLSFAAAATKKLLLGTGICLIPEREPIVTAKCVASLDQLSGGRFIFGIGGGWIPRPVGDFTAKGAVDRLRRMAETARRDPERCRSLCSARRPTRRLSPSIAKPASTRRYSKCPI
jgi:alkanesulfonate monooxygenase SsuD/methylene tetrahydromethanopterin reductase-like flavin-dependent oxidoreductase (luciferase family)